MVPVVALLCLLLTGLVLLLAPLADAPLWAQERPPIIDVHLHALDSLAREADGTPKARFCFPEPCVHTPAVAERDGDVLRLTLEAMDRFNIVLGVVSERPKQVLPWKAAAPDRFLTGFSMDHPSEVSISELREHFASGRFQVLGELAFQYDGVPIDDPILDRMYALAEELDVPVHVHVSGLGGSDDFPVHLGNPLRLSRVLRKFPGLRIYVENAGWPFLEEITSLMYQYPNVYADLSTITWVIPRGVFHRYLRGLIENGLAQRLMFGSDQMWWPETIELAIEAIETADFLTEDQKRDIFYNNAARFLGLSPAQIARHHEP